MSDQVHDEAVDNRLKQTNFIMWVNTIANVVGTVVLVAIALYGLFK